MGTARESIADGGIRRMVSAETHFARGALPRTLLAVPFMVVVIALVCAARLPSVACGCVSAILASVLYPFFGRLL